MRRYAEHEISQFVHLLIVLGCLGVAWGNADSERERNWSVLLDRVGDAMYSDDPVEELDRLAGDFGGDTLQYRADPVQFVRRAQLLIDELPDSALQVERTFWRGGFVDTTFVSARADVTGDGREEDVIAQVWRDYHSIFLRLYIGAGDGAKEILRHEIWHTEEWSPVPRLAYSFAKAVEYGQRAEMVDPERGFVIPSIIYEDVARISGLKAGDVEEDVKTYINSFPGKAVWASDGVNGSCHIYYAPLDQFVLLYMP